MFPIIFFIFGLMAALIRLARTKKRTKAKTIEVLFVYLLVSNIGLVALFGAAFQIFQAPETAAKIGWAPSPFEFEVAMANIAIAVAALFGIFWRGRYLMGPVIASTIFLYGDAYGHFVQAAKGDTAPYNSGIFLWAGDIIIPTIILILAIMYYSTTIQKSKTK